MCGIAGIINYDSTPVSIESLKLMTSSIKHRGPDGEGHWISENKKIGFGHRRLSIIDLSQLGSQPMHYMNGRYTITFNGEIYNYLELKNNLIEKGYSFKSNSDTEVLLAIYDLKKERCLEELEGMFAFLIYDALEDSIFIARDRFGEKPFFYIESKEGLFFSSEIKSFWAVGKTRSLDLETAFYFLQYGRVHHPFDQERTFFNDVKKLKPGHYIQIKKRGEKIVQRSYFQLSNMNLKESDISVEEAKSTFFELFKGSVERRLRSDVPIGSSLSGGLDSSAVVCMIDYLNKENLFKQVTFSARFPGFSKDEGNYMQIVSEATNSEPFYTFPNQNGFLDNFEKMCYHQDEPFGSASIYAQYEVMRLAKNNNVTVLLDGQGADEMLAGYSFYQETLVRAMQSISSSQGQMSGRSKMVNMFKSALPIAYKMYHKRRLREDVKRKLNEQGFSKDFIGYAMDLPVPEEFHQNLTDHLVHDLTKGNLEDLLRYSDRNSMAHSLEVRLPFLDKDLVRFVVSLPDSYKIKDGWSKWIQREAMRPIVPDEIVWRKDKIGYEPPQKDWMGDSKISERIRENRNRLYDNNIISKVEAEREPMAVAANQINDNSWYQLMIGEYLK